MIVGERHRIRAGLSAARLVGGGVRLEHWGNVEDVGPTVLSSEDFTAEEWCALVAAVAAPPGGDTTIAQAFNHQVITNEIVNIHLGRHR